MLNFLKSIFRPNNDKIKFGSCFGVLHGQFVGELFVFMEEVNDVLYFLSIPNMKTREVPREKYDYAIQNNVLEYVEILPKSERTLCKLQYKSNTNNNENK
jgi:hypothetical protein